MHQLFNLFRAHRRTEHHAELQHGAHHDHTQTLLERHAASRWPAWPRTTDCQMTGLCEREGGGRCAGENEREKRYRLVVTMDGPATNHDDRNGRNDQPERGENDWREAGGNGRKNAAKTTMAIQRTATVFRVRVFTVRIYGK